MNGLFWNLQSLQLCKSLQLCHQLQVVQHTSMLLWTMAWDRTYLHGGRSGGYLLWYNLNKRTKYQEGLLVVSWWRTILGLCFRPFSPLDDFLRYLPYTWGSWALSPGFSISSAWGGSCLKLRCSPPLLNAKYIPFMKIIVSTSVCGEVTKLPGLPLHLLFFTSKGLC